MARPPDAVGQTRAQTQAWAQSLKGAAAMVSGSTRRARAHFTASLAKVDAPEIRTAVALTHAARRRFRPALALLESLVTKQAALPELHYWRARVFLALRKPTKACRAMDLALSLGGDRPEYLVAKALTCKEAGRSAEAARALARAARRHGDLMDPGMYPDPMYGVLELVLKSLKTFPNQRRALVAVAHLFIRARHYRRAETLSARMRKRWGQVHEALFLKARCRLAAGDTAAALTWADRVLGSRPSDGAALALRAEVYLAAGKKDKARADLERAVKRNPSHAVNLSRLGMLQWEKGNYAVAERLFRYALERNARLASAHHGTAQALDRRKQYARADAHHRQALKLSPANPVYRQSYAVFLQRRARGATARKYLAAARVHLAVARKLNGFLKRFRKKLDRARKYARSLSRARRLAAAGKSREAARKLNAVRGPQAPKSFLKAHWAAAAGKSPATWARKALAGLSARRLLNISRRVAMVELKASLRPKFPVVMRRYLLWVNPTYFR